MSSAIEFLILCNVGPLQRCSTLPSSRGQSLNRSWSSHGRLLITSVIGLFFMFFSYSIIVNFSISKNQIPPSDHLFLLLTFRFSTHLINGLLFLFFFENKLFLNRVTTFLYMLSSPPSQLACHVFGISHSPNAHAATHRRIGAATARQWVIMN